MDNNTIKAENRLDVDILEKVSGGTGEEFYVGGEVSNTDGLHGHHGCRAQYIVRV